MAYSQYNEEQVLLNFFKQKRKGFLIEVGAANGIVNSNTRNLIENYQWSGILIEPNPFSFVELQKLYLNNDKISTINKGVADVVEDQKMDLHIYGNNQVDYQISSFDSSFRQRIINKRGDNYSRVVPVEISSLKNILTEANINKKIDFMSVDCEGFDLQVINSNCWKTYRPVLVCVETSMSIQVLVSLMEEKGYKYFTKTAGNMFFIDNRTK